jgi:hypothetical protein
MGKHDFDNMINKVMARKSVKKKQRTYRNRNFKVIFETEKRIVIPYESLLYL